MVSKRIFFTITMVMAIVFCLFQFSGAAKENLNEYSSNRYDTDTSTNLTSADNAEDTAGHVVYIGDLEKPGIGTTVSQWCGYTGREAEAYDSLENFTEGYTEISPQPEMVLLDADYIVWDTQAGSLQKLMAQGVNLVFCSLPKPEVVVRSEEIMDLLGIATSPTIEIELSGLRLFSGFLLGGTVEYEAKTEEDRLRQDMELVVPWYNISSGTKCYMSGMLPKDSFSDIKNEYLPAIIWRNSTGKGQAYVVNGDYLSDSRGIGILSAFAYEMNDYDIYPVVNAQNIAVLAYPVLSEENSEKMEELYSRSSTAFFRDVVWSGLASLNSRMGSKITYLFTPRLDYTNGSGPNAGQLEYYFRLIGEQDSEAGLLGSALGMGVREKFNEDYEFLNQYLPDYKFTSCYLDGDSGIQEQLDTHVSQDVRTVLRDFEEHGPLLFYETDKVTGQRSISSGVSHTYTQDFMLRSVETALGYSTAVMDMEAVLYPETEEDRWENYFKKASSNISSFWKPFRAFDWTTLSESDKRIREFFALSCTSKREGDTVTVKLSGFRDEAFLMLRTHGEYIDTIEGAEYEKIEEDAYLLRAENNRIVIKLAEEKQPWYQED